MAQKAVDHQPSPGGAGSKSKICSCAEMSLVDLTADLRLNTTSFSGSFFWLITCDRQRFSTVGQTLANPIPEQVEGQNVYTRARKPFIT